MILSVVQVHIAAAMYCMLSMSMPLSSLGRAPMHRIAPHPSSQLICDSAFAVLGLPELAIGWLRPCLILQVIDVIVM